MLRGGYCARAAGEVVQRRVGAKDAATGPVVGEAGTNGGDVRRKPAAAQCPVMALRVYISPAGWGGAAGRGQRGRIGEVGLRADAGITLDVGLPVLVMSINPTGAVKWELAKWELGGVWGLEGSTAHKRAMGAYVS